MNPSSALSTAAAPRDEAERPRKPWPRWTREPLLHFVLIGALLFAADHVLFARADDPHTIVIDAGVDREAATMFESARGRPPDTAEREALRRAWLDNEVLYREGLSLGVDKGDTAIRERVIFKALSVVEANMKPPEPNDATLRTWFEKNRARYDEPERFDFQEAVLSGDMGESAVRAFVERLNRGAPGDLDAGLRVYKGRPHSNLVDGYGEAFASAFERAAPGEWRAWQTRGGWRAMRLDARSPAKPASFETLRGVVLHDWVDATMAEQRTAAVRALQKKYVVKVEAGR